jgi:hypothetical protein
MSAVTMTNHIPDVIEALQRYQVEQVALIAQNTAGRTRELIPPSEWQEALQASVYAIIPGSGIDEYAEAAENYRSLVIAKISDLAQRGIPDLTFHSLDDLAQPLPKETPADGQAKVSSCADIDKLNSVAVDKPIGSTFWDDLAAQLDVEELADSDALFSGLLGETYG